MTLIDTNVVIDVLSADPVWLDWSARQIEDCQRTGLLSINEMTYAELAVHAQSEVQLRRTLDELAIEIERIPTPALFVAGQAFRRYRQAGGPRTTVLPDFFIGAHAQIAGIPILTRDVRRFRRYFPKVRLITP